MRQLRLSRVGELREVLETLQKKNPKGYEQLVAIVDAYAFRRVPAPR